MVSITLLSPTMQGVRNASLEQIVALIDAAFSAHCEMEKSLGEADAAKEVETLRKVLAEKSRALNEGMIKIAHDMERSLIIDETRGLNQAASELVPRPTTAERSAASDQVAIKRETDPNKMSLFDRYRAVDQAYFARFMSSLPQDPAVSRVAPIGLLSQQQRDLERGEQLRLREEILLRGPQDQLERERTELSLLKQRREREQRERERLERGTPPTPSEMREDKYRLRDEQFTELQLKLIGRPDRNRLSELFYEQMEEDKPKKRQDADRIVRDRRARERGLPRQRGKR